MSELRFDGRSVIVTGGGRGIGRCHSLLFASRGAKVVVADIGNSVEGDGSSAEPAEQVVKEIEAAGGEAVACFADVTDEQGAASIVKTAMESFGRLDVVVNNAGIVALERFEDLTVDRFRRMIDVHFLGTVQVTKAAWPHLMEAGYGRIVNTCSEAAIGTVPKNTAYGSAKGSILGFTRTLALDGPKFGIQVNAVAPRANTRMATPEILSHVYDAPPEAFESDSMAVFKPELFSPTAVFLAHESCTLNGEILVSGGGTVLRIAIMETTGITDPDLTPEAVRDNLDQVLDMTDAQLVNAGVVFDQ